MYGLGLLTPYGAEGERAMGEFIELFDKRDDEQEEVEEQEYWDTYEQAFKEE